MNGEEQKPISIESNKMISIGANDTRRPGESWLNRKVEPSKGKNKLLKFGAAGITIAAGLAYLTTLFAHDSNPQPIQPIKEPQKASDTLNRINSMDDLKASQLEGQAKRENAAILKVGAEAENIAEEVAKEPKFYGPPSSVKK